eukprot:7247900-Lingulodinium_polyedra.AAC.1
MSEICYRAPSSSLRHSNHPIAKTCVGRERPSPIAEPRAKMAANGARHCKSTARCTHLQNNKCDT